VAAGGSLPEIPLTPAQQPLPCDLDQHFGLATRDRDSRPHAQCQISESRRAQNILQRLAGKPPAEEFAEMRLLRVGGFVLRMREEKDARPLQCVAEQKLRLEAGVSRTHPPECVGRICDQPVDHPCNSPNRIIAERAGIR